MGQNFFCSFFLSGEMGDFTVFFKKNEKLKTKKKAPIMAACHQPCRRLLLAIAWPSQTRKRRGWAKERKKFEINLWKMEKKNSSLLPNTNFKRLKIYNCELERSFVASKFRVMVWKTHCLGGFLVASRRGVFAHVHDCSPCGSRSRFLLCGSCTTFCQCFF